MALEIERKFRVLDETWREHVVNVRQIRQAYLTKCNDKSIRIRIDGNDRATLTVKTRTPGIARNEYEYSIPIGDAEELIQSRDGSIIVKCRHLVPDQNLVWEIDVFEGENAGLVIAEIELKSPDQPFNRPVWLGKEVTDDRRYYNGSLAGYPYSGWRALDHERQTVA